jgi:hypothetical protein
MRGRAKLGGVTTWTTRNEFMAVKKPAKNT